ncbi:hypothetical protein CALVIDRAFT_385606 [Calocera viscosa TUFC12733]|uniref:Uncharacterized protein n=1 Tax=Calocera viscosa (strain TUFC12733) TaxID=1330018 RepID=A0A167GMP7_CALVF|nr:hypothetical protein CALVIDRAFT_385606 [Calocera viscosa TUFC12733]
MLPTHLNRGRRPFAAQYVNPLSQPIGRLRQRSRFTNLAILLLASFTGLSLLLNIRYFLVSFHDHHEDSRPVLQIWKPPNEAEADVPRSIEEVVTRSEEHTNLTNLIIVAGHAIWNGALAFQEPAHILTHPGCFPEKRGDEIDWILEPAQKATASASIKAFWSHIVKGAEQVLADDSSLLVFSGGRTRALTPHLSEASSYLSLGIESNVFQSNFLPHPRVTTEDYSLDSFQNLLFSIARFREVVGRYPEKITVVGFGMKEARFTELHRKAIRWPLKRSTWSYIGVDLDGSGKDVAVDGERKYGYMPFTKDLYGCHSSLLDKRKGRNPHSRTHPFHSSAPELRNLLEWCPTDGVEPFRGSLPWDVHGEYLED